MAKDGLEWRNLSTDLRDKSDRDFEEKMMVCLGMGYRNYSKVEAKIMQEFRDLLRDGGPDAA